jgi:NDP-4-keto-2,6-dideoxyhexose 3-C-methyltransferase
MSIRIDSCRSCGSQKLEIVFDVGDLAITVRFPKAGDPDPFSSPLELLYCKDCSLVQLAHTIDSDELFRNEYGYRSGINASMRAHLQGIYQAVASKISLSNSDTVLDIGSNDSTLLQCYPTYGPRRIGIDPTSEQFAKYYPPEIVRVPDYFTKQVFSAASDAPAKVITSISMFYDLHDPNQFVSDIAASLHTDGLWVLEQSYVLRMLEQNAYDTICHEHLEYYGLKQIVDIVSRQGLRVFDVDFNDCNGGSFRVFVCHNHASFEQSKIVNETLENEIKYGLNTPKPYYDFRKRSEQLKDDLMTFLSAAQNNGESVYIYGASTKGNTVLQYCGVTTDHIVAAAERNPEKWGRRTPGTNIPIISEEEARSQNPNYLLVLPWHFREEFLIRERPFMEQGGRMVFPFPHLEIVGNS